MCRFTKGSKWKRFSERQVVSHVLRTWLSDCVQWMQCYIHVTILVLFQMTFKKKKTHKMLCSRKFIVQKCVLWRHFGHFHRNRAAKLKRINGISYKNQTGSALVNSYRKYSQKFVDLCLNVVSKCRYSQRFDGSISKNVHISSDAKCLFDLKTQSHVPTTDLQVEKCFKVSLTKTLNHLPLICVWCSSEAKRQSLKTTCFG